MSSCVVVVRSSVHCMSDDFSVPSFFAFWRSARSWWLVKYGSEWPTTSRTEPDREKLRVHVKLGCPDGYTVDLGQVKGHFPYVEEQQINVELVRGGLTHPTGSFADGGVAAEDIVVVNAAVSVTYHGGSL